MTAATEAAAAATLEGVAADVATAVAQVREQFPGHNVGAIPDGAGGAVVVVDDVTPGDQYLEEVTWLGFQITSVYPDADIYPHFVGPLRRKDGRPNGEGFQEVDWQGRPALQLSRRSNHWNRATDTAALKAMKVMAWLASR